MSNSIQQLFSIYDRLEKILPTQAKDNIAFRELQTIFEDKREESDATIMVYGVYNAGKSTLINALIGKEVAEVDDVPKTAIVSEYKCNNYLILDTPGIDAPLEHEEITQAQLIKTDMIIFVVNPVGVAEEKKTLSALVDLFMQNKKVFIVFNEKDTFSDSDFIKLKDQTWKLLQDIASERSLNTNIISQVPIFKIDAKTALEGKLTNEQLLIEVSGYYELENALNKFINSNIKIVVFDRLKAQLSTFIEKLSKDLESSSNSEVVKQYEGFIREISQEKITIRKDLFEEVNISQSDLYRNIRHLLDAENEDAQSVVQESIENKSKLIGTQLSDALNHIQLKIQSQIDMLQTAELSAEMNIDNANIEIKPIDSSAEENSINFETNQSNIDINKLKDVAQYASFIKQEHIIAGLKLTKEYFPNLMKNIGPRTMEKIASKVVAKHIPAIGTVITVGFALKDILSEDESTAQARRQAEELKQARLRREQQIDDTAKQISESFGDNLKLAIHEQINGFFAELVAKVNDVSEGFSAVDKQNSNLNEKLLELQQSLAAVNS